MSKFHPVSPQVDLPAMEQDVLRFWKSADVFGQAQKQTAHARVTFSSKTSHIQ